MALIRCWSFVDLMFLEFFHFHCHMLSYDNRIKQLPFQVAAFKNKVFCGTYARGGDIFMSACQDRKVTFFNEISETLMVCPRSGYTTHPNWVSSWSRQSRPRYVFGNVFYFFIIFHQRKISNDILSLSGCWLECFRRGIESGRRSSGLFIMVRQPSPGGGHWDWDHDYDKIFKLQANILDKDYDYDYDRWTSWTKRIDKLVYPSILMGGR